MEERVTRVEEQIKTLFGDTEEMKKDIKEIKDKLLGRPTWAVLVVITFLSSLSIGLVVALLR